MKHLDFRRHADVEVARSGSEQEVDQGDTSVTLAEAKAMPSKGNDL